MATAVEPRPTKDDSVVERSIASAAARVRANDLLTGGAALAVLALAYVAVTVVLDKWLALPAWGRQLGFAGFLVAAAAVAYFAVVVPFRRRVNPRYIARQVEQTIPDAKNVLINWVDLQDRELPGSVKSAVAAKAADGLADADVDTATNSKRLLWLGIAAGVLVATLAVLFLVFKWTQFSSLVGRAVNPFADTAIASRTQIDLLEPAGGDATVTDGEQMNVAIAISGRVPDANGPEKPRLLVRHNPDAAGYDELPLVRGESSREFALMVPRSVIQNGFWYKVAAGDAETPEYRVTVRTRPLLTGFDAKYEYPAYLKWPSLVGTDARLKAHRGTAVTLTVATNREVKSGTLTATTGQQVETTRGEVTGEKNGSLRFQLQLTESGTYRVQFQPTGGEPSFVSAEYPIEVVSDEKPTVTITSPKDEEITLPPNGLLAVDAEITDDHGIASAALRFQIEGRPTVVIPAKKYRDGKPFVREKDGSFETQVRDYKDSVKLDALADETGKPLALKEGDVLTYRVEATDNCEPTPNVGASKGQRVRIIAPPPAPTPEQKKQQQQREQQRKGDEQKAHQQQQERQKNDTRPPDQARDPDPEKQPQQPPQDPMGEKKEGDPKGDGKQDTNPMGGKGENEPKKKTGDPMGVDKTGERNPNEKADTKPDPNAKPDTKPDDTPQDKKNGSGGGAGGKSDQEIQKQAEDLKQKLDEKKGEPGDAKGDGSNTPQGTETKPDAGAKSPPPDQKGGEKNAAEEKGGEKSGDPKSDQSKAGEPKDGGKLTEPDRAEPKAGPKPDAKPNEKPTDDKTKTGPKDGTDPAASSKETKPEEGNTQPGDKKDAAGSAKGAKPEKGDKTEQPQPMGGGTDSKDKSDAKDPNDLSGAKEKGTPERGETKKEEKGSKGGGDQQQPKDDKADGGEAKGEKPSAPGAKKEAQPDNKADGSPMDKKGPPPDAGQEKGPPKADAADPMGKKDESADGKGAGQQDKPDAKAETKPDPKGGIGEKDPKQQKQPGGGPDDKQKLDPKEMEKAVRELDSENPGSRKDAQEKLDKAVGKENRETVERLNRDLKSGDPKKQEEAKKEIDELSKKSGQQQPKPRELTEQEKKELGEAAKNLNSKNDAERKAAEQKLDDAIGKDKRDELQKDLKDLIGDDPQKAQAAQEKLEQMAKDAKNGNGKELDERTRKLGGGNLDKEGKPIEANPENQLKSQELTLKKLKDMRDNKEFLQENKYTPEEYAQFLKGYEEMVNRTRDDLDKQRVNPTAAKPSGPTTIRNDGDTNRVVGRTPEAGSAQGPGGASVAPPGFAEAQKRYAEQAAKREAEKKQK